MNSEQDFKCIFCSETFSEKEELQIHFRKHGNPNFNQKKVRRRSQDEADVTSEKPKDQAEAVECDVCTEVFTSISKAITHKHKVHPDHDTKYFCPWCGKLFTMKHLYNKHMAASHSGTEKNGDRLFHCDSCDVNFHLPTAMVYHNKFYHRQDELPALGQTKKLQMVLEEIVNIYYCPFCGEEYDNKVNLTKHINEEHSGENRSPDYVFRCPLCDGTFFYLDAYELHLTYHSSEDMYTERNEMLNQITDFSLETVQPLQERVENAESIQEDESKAIGIEALLELTMDDTSGNRKSKKHKKHKKSKKSAITLDEFLNMNKDVFGEGIDFQGIEEVPTQAVAKRLKTKKPVSASKLMSSDLAKLKKQGIVVKKQQTKAGKPVINKGASNTAVKMLNSTNILPKTKTNILTSTDDVLSKLLHQGSQIKIVKKSNQDTQKEEANSDEDPKNTSANNEEIKNEHVSDETETKEQHTDASNNENIDVKNSKNDSVKNKTINEPTIASPSIIGHNTDIRALQNSQEDSNSSAKSHKDDSHAQLEKSSNLAEKINALRNNSNIAMKSSKQTLSEKKVETSNNQENDDVGRTQIKELDTADEIKPPSTSGQSSLNALKRLSHLITVKPLNPAPNAPISDDNKPETDCQKEEETKASQNNNSHKTSETINFTNLKSLGGLTIKSTTQSSLNTVKKSQLVEADDNYDRNNDESDDEWDTNKNMENKMNVDKITQMLKSPQVRIQTKHSPKMIQRESPKVTTHNDNSQSSADLLKHLKNVTAKPVNANSQTTPTPKSSPSSINKGAIAKTLLQKELTEDGIEIFNIDDSDSDDANYNKTRNTTTKTESKIEAIKSNDVMMNINKNIIIKSTNQQNKNVKKDVKAQSNKAFDDEDNDCSDDMHDKETHASSPDMHFSSPKPNQKHTAINNVLKNLSKNITVKSRNSSPSQFIPSQDQNSRDSHMETNDADSDSNSPLSRVKITEMENSEDEFPQDHIENNISRGNVKVQHPDDSHSEHEDEPMDDEFDDMTDIESQIVAAKVQKDISRLNTNNLNIVAKVKPFNNKNTMNNKSECPQPTDEIPQFAKNLSNQVSIKHIKKPESNKNTKVVEQMASQSMNQSSINQKMSTSNQVNTFNKEVKTVKTFQTQTKTVIQEITTTVTKTIKTVNQTQKQEVRNIAQSSSMPMLPQKIQGINSNFSPKSFQGVKVRQSAPPVRPKIRGQAPQTTRPAICAPPQATRLAICAPPLASRPICAPVRPNQVVPPRPTLNRPSGPRPRLPHVVNMRASTSGQQRPQIGRPVKVSPSAVLSSPKRSAEPPGHFSCFKKPKESLIPVPDYSLMNQNDGESSMQFSSAMQMSKSNFTSTTKTVKGNSVVTSTQMKSEMSASSQQLSKLRNMSGLSVAKTSQSQAKQTQVEENSEISASKRNTLEAIQKLQSQGLLVKKPRLDVSEDSDHSEPGSDDMRHDSNEEFDE